MKKRKRESNKLNARTRINNGSAFTRWRELKDEEGCPTDADLALLLLDLFSSSSSPCSCRLGQAMVEGRNEVHHLQDYIGSGKLPQSHPHVCREAVLLHSSSLSHADSARCDRLYILQEVQKK